jgi:pyocin large subunit-like protein
MGGFKLALCAGAALLVLAGCERPSAVASADVAPPAYEGTSASRERMAEAPREREAADLRDAPIPEIDGKPMWSASRRYSAQENAQRAYDRNGEAFGARDVDDFVRKAHAFVDAPPKGALTLTRANGDRLIYDPKANVFAVVTRAGAPRTMFKPDDGMAYWQEQVDREASRRQASAERGRQAEEG